MSGEVNGWVGGWVGELVGGGGAEERRGGGRGEREGGGGGGGEEGGKGVRDHIGLGYFTFFFPAFTFLRDSKSRLVLGGPLKKNPSTASES